MQIVAPSNSNEDIERERKELHRLIELGASKEEIQRQSEALDKHIVDYYKPLRKTFY